MCRSGSRDVWGISTSPSGINPLACTVTPKPAKQAALSPLKLPLVQAMRHVRPARSNASSATARVMLGGL